MAKGPTQNWRFNKEKNKKHASGTLRIKLTSGLNHKGGPRGRGSSSLPKEDPEEP